MSKYFTKRWFTEFSDFEQQRIKLMTEIAKAVSQKTGEKFVLKGGTALLLAYDLPRFSTDLGFDGKDSSIDITSFIKESAANAGVSIKELNVNKDTRATKRYMLHYEGAENLPLKIEVSLRDSAQFDEKDVRIVNNIRVYSVEKLAELKTEAFIHRIKARDIYDVAFLLEKYPDRIQKETFTKIINRTQDLGIDFFDITMRQDEVLKNHDTESIALSINENIEKYQQEKEKDKNRFMELHPAQPERVYSGEIISFQDDSVIQEISPDVAIEHRGLAGAMRQDDIGKHFSIAYDNKGAIEITQEKSRDRSNGIDR